MAEINRRLAIRRVTWPNGAICNVHDLNARKIKLRATEQPVDTGSAAGKAFLDMLGVFAEFETNLRRERQAEGIAAAKAEGIYKGRPPKIEIGKIREKASGAGVTEIAKALKISRQSVYRLLGEQAPDCPEAA